MRRRKVSSEEIAGFLDRGTAATGELHFSGALRIDGNFYGSIETSGVLVVGLNAVVHADINAGELEVQGHASGSIDAKRRVEIHSTGRLNADVRTPIIVIEAGGTFDGRCRMAVAEKDDNANAGKTELEGVDEAYGSS